MASYLEDYGQGEEQHAKRVRLFRWIVVLLAVGLILGAVLYSALKNRSEQHEITAFVELLKKKDYQAAYRMWGCTETTPCRDYSFSKFMEDWGPNSPHADVAAAQIGSPDTCGTGVVVPVDFRGSESVPLWVERGTKTIGFSPDPECRKKHWHFGEFFRSLFSKASLLQLKH